MTTLQWVSPSDGSTATLEPLRPLPGAYRSPRLSADGKRIALWTVPLDDQGGQLKAGTAEPFLTSTFSDEAPSFSPDGRWLAYQSDESGRNEV